MAGDDNSSLFRTTAIALAGSKQSDEADLSWRMLAMLGVFRLLVAGGLILAFFLSSDPHMFGDRYPLLFASTVSAYAVFAIATQLFIKSRRLPVAVIAAAALLVDTLVTIGLMHMSGGLSSGLGGLLIVFVGVACLVLPAQWPAVMAAIATFGILGEQFLTQVSRGDPNFPAAGLLSALIFMMAIAAQSLGKRIQASEALARQRGVDLKNLSELNEYIVQHLRESILVVDGNNRVRLSNGSAARLIGSELDLANLSLGDASQPLDDYISRWRDDHSLSSHTEIPLVSRNASLRITAHLAPLVKDGERSGPILIFLEDSSLMNERVQQSKLASLGRLSASIAHEIRNPVGAMSHAAQLLAESDALSDDDLRLTDIIQSNSERVSHIIDNVLQLSRRESSRPERLELGPWLDDFAREFTRTLELQEGELKLHPVDDDISVRMDRSHLRQVLWNLCDNAVKYASETGGILVEIRVGRLEGHSRPFLEVMDHGYGVDAATADKIFEPFFTARHGGTGLGLYISRELCELNRATLLYLDREGGGSIFRIVFADPERWGNQDSQ